MQATSGQYRHQGSGTFTAQCALALGNNKPKSLLIQISARAATSVHIMNSRLTPREIYSHKYIEKQFFHTTSKVAPLGLNIGEDQQTEKKENRNNQPKRQPTNPINAWMCKDATAAAATIAAEQGDHKFASTSH
ncbi:unnamed protein product [Ceratitis capitata]|uniref:(Mediterranean fruit fly) hypothetical protein n=1 Tax=Ceratitis capitata TaxID=7213 RepID=A0A811VE91_CERCA|nr:unnamed protein product [Ceratitis capitata]